MSRCPDCDAKLTAENLNLSEGVGICPACDAIYRISELNSSKRSLEEIIANPPDSCQLNQVDGQIHIIASTYSFSGFLISLGIALFWNGVVSVFVSVALAGLYFNLIGPVPDWFPAVGIENGKPIMNDKPMTLGMTLFLCLFLTPFLAVGAAMISSVLLCLWGKVEVVLSEYESWAATSVWGIKWKKRFDSTDVEKVNEVISSRGDDGGTSKCLQIVTPHKSHKFGHMYTDQQREWVKALLTVFLTNEKFRQKFSHLLG